jgi:AbrB family looped-hinge helix DNA binding protein
MMGSVTARTYAVRLRSRGQMTIPQAVREELAAAEGDLLTLLQIEDDLLLLTPRELRVPALQARFAEEMEKAGVSLAELLQGLAVEREDSARAQRGRTGDSA